MAGIQSSSAAYQTALEGVSYGSDIIERKTEELYDIVNSIAKPEVMGGSTGEEYCNRIREACAVTVALVEKFKKFKIKVSDVCVANEATVDKLSGSAEERQRAFKQIASQIEANKGKGG